MWKLATAALAALFSALPAQANFINMNVWPLVQGQPNRGYGGGQILLKFGIPEGHPMDVGLPDIASFQFNFILGSNNSDAILTLDLSGVQSFSALVYGQNGGASPRFFDMVVHVDKWEIRGNADPQPPATMYFKDRSYRLVADNGRLMSSGYLGLGVPEPAAWALMLAGFGLVGATLRQRRPSMLSRAQHRECQTAYRPFQQPQ